MVLDTWPFDCCELWPDGSILFFACFQLQEIFSDCLDCNEGGLLALSRDSLLLFLLESFSIL